MGALESAFLTNCPGDSWAYWSLRIPEKHLRPLQKIYCMHDASLPSLPFTPSLFFPRRESWRAALPFSPLISCCLLLPLLAAPFFLLILGRTTVTQESYLLFEYLQSLRSTYVSFSLVIIQYGCWRGAVHTSHAAEFQFHGNHQSFPLVGWIFASCWRESPDLECEQSRKVFPSVLIEYKSAALWASVRRTLPPFSTHFIPAAFFLSISRRHCLYAPWITPFLCTSSNSSDIHSDQTTARTSATKRLARESPCKDLTFYILKISVCGCLHRNQTQVVRSSKLWCTGPCSSASAWVRPLRLWLHSKSSCLVVEQAVQKHWSVSLSYLLDGVNSVSSSSGLSWWMRVVWGEYWGHSLDHPRKESPKREIWSL